MARGQTKRLRVRLTRAGRIYIKRKRRVRAKLTASWKDTAGHRSSTTRRLTILAPRRR